ncbi:hypothetical protein CHS0354_034533 [Potamilus streckersoni]|uniref:sphingosine kinase n=1 Tax=Potamilus streckersoni TaxID=2493646 RepID=A0AAE0SFF8_9BIVA|nr:hypothetical protein CHS0354_034533 [Potamilus streckersoni]
MKMAVSKASPRDEVLLEGEFDLFPKDKPLYKVTLSRGGITYYPITGSNNIKNSKYLHFGDIIGCRCKKAKDEKYQSKAYLTIFLYPFKKKLFSSKLIRNREIVTFGANSRNKFEENRVLVETWRRVIMHLANNLSVELKAVDRCPVPPKKNFLVLINPHSGPGKAMQIFQDDVVPMLDEAEVKYDLIKTEYAGHASQLVKERNIYEWDGIVIVSGDGLIYEVVNGLMQRDDWQKAIKVPIGCLPGGSGNALCCSINYSAGESFKSNCILHSTFILIKHKVVPMDLVLIQQPDLPPVYSFLAVTWGLIADIDHESEKYRAIGEARFMLQGLKRIFNLRVYKGRLSFLPITSYLPKSGNGTDSSKKVSSKQRFKRLSLHSVGDSFVDNSMDDEETNLERRPRTKSVPAYPYQENSDHASVSQMEDNDLDNVLDQDRLQSLSLNVSECDISTGKQNVDLENSLICDGKVAQHFSSDVERNMQKSDSMRGYAESGKYVDSGFVAAKTSGSLDSLDLIEKLTATKVPGKPAPSPLLVPFSKSVPMDWVTVEEDFITVCATYQTHLNSDFLAAPDAHINDGIIHLFFVRSGIGKSELLKLFTEMDNGSHVDSTSPYIEVVKVLAFRLEPAENQGVMMVDGEKVASAPVQGQVLPGLARIMGIH